MMLKSTVAIQRLLSQWSSPSYLMMVGVPGVGKSTFIEMLKTKLDEVTFTASTDNLLEEEAKKLGITYTEAFHRVNQKQLKQRMDAGIANAIEKRLTIIHDQTNMSRKSRTAKLKNVPSTYFKICVNFTVDDKVLKQRLEARAKVTGKEIPDFVLKSMFDSYNPPSRDEGFNLILEVDNT